MRVLSCVRLARGAEEGSVACNEFVFAANVLQAEAQAARHEETAQGLAAVLAAGNMSREDQEDREAKESKAKQLAVAWRARAEGLQKEADVLAGQVKAVLGAGEAANNCEHA